LLAEVVEEEEDEEEEDNGGEYAVEFCRCSHIQNRA
jgi:hypothetical protein